MPISYFIGARGESFLIDPFRYEIRVYRSERLQGTLSGPAPYSSGFVGFSESRIDGKLASLISGAIAPPRICEANGLILVFHIKDREGVPSGLTRIFRVDVFAADRLVKSFDTALEGYPNFVSPEGYLFTHGTMQNPFVNVYALWPLLK